MRYFLLDTLLSTAAQLKHSLVIPHYQLALLQIHNLEPGIFSFYLIITIKRRRLTPIMLCKVCIQGLQGIWDPTKTTRVCLLKDLSAQYRQQLPQYPVNTHMISDQHNSLELSCPEKYVFAHHRTQESLRASILEGCVMCQVFTNHLEADTHHPPVHGYYSLFTVSCQGGTTMMHICVNGSCIGLELCRYGELFVLFVCSITSYVLGMCFFCSHIMFSFHSIPLTFTGFHRVYSLAKQNS